MMIWTFCTFKLFFACGSKRRQRDFGSNFCGLLWKFEWKVSVPNVWNCPRFLPLSTVPFPFCSPKELVLFVWTLPVFVCGERLLFHWVFAFSFKNTRDWQFLFLTMTSFEFKSQYVILLILYWCNSGNCRYFCSVLAPLRHLRGQSLSYDLTSLIPKDMTPILPWTIMTCVCDRQL